MTHVMQDEKGEWHGWGKILDYIGVEWRYPEMWIASEEEAKDA